MSSALPSRFSNFLDPGDVLNWGQLADLVQAPVQDEQPGVLLEREDAMDVVDLSLSLRDIHFVSTDEEGGLNSEPRGLHLDKPIGAIRLKGADVVSKTIALRDSDMLDLTSQPVPAYSEESRSLECDSELLAHPAE